MITAENSALFLMRASTSDSVSQAAIRTHINTSHADGIEGILSAYI